MIWSTYCSQCHNVIRVLMWFLSFTLRPGPQASIYRTALHLKVLASWSCCSRSCDFQLRSKASTASTLSCADKVARLEDARHLLYDARDACEAGTLAQQLNNIRKDEGIPPIQLDELGQCHARPVDAIGYYLICQVGILAGKNMPAAQPCHAPPLQDAPLKLDTMSRVARGHSVAGAASI